MNRLGFTLIQLLVVIAIIAVLASLLMLSSSMVRDQARRINCASNLRQWGWGIIAHAQDNGGKIPRTWISGGGNYPPTPFMFWLNADPALSDQVAAEPLAEYLEPVPKPHIFNNAWLGLAAGVFHGASIEATS